jgi:hypothetical protein
MGLTLRKTALYLVLTASVAGVAMTLIVLYANVSPLDALGKASDSCVVGDFSPVPNGSGLVATGHVTSCGWFIVHGDDTTYVYVHKDGANDGRGSLVFRYFNLGHLDDPEMTWSDKSNLHISVHAVGEVTKQVSTIDGVKILYSIGTTDVPAEELDRVRRRIALVSAVLLVFLTAICVIIAKSIRNLNRP